MKNKVKGFIFGVALMLFLSNFTVFGAGVQQVIEVVLNSVNLTVNGQRVQADTILYNGTTFVPLRATAEMLGKEVGWDSSTNTASINDKGGSTPKVSTGNYSRTNPAPIGAKQSVKVSNFSEEYIAEVKVSDIIRGEKALELILAANQFNDVPSAEEEYILAKIYLRISESKDDKQVTFGSYSFDLYSGSSARYDEFYSVVEPSPQLSTALYAGAEHEGYITFKVKKSDTAPKICFGANYDGTGGIWFSLSK